MASFVFFIFFSRSLFLSLFSHTNDKEGTLNKESLTGAPSLFRLLAILALLGTSSLFGNIWEPSPCFILLTKYLNGCHDGSSPSNGTRRRRWHNTPALQNGQPRTKTARELADELTKRHSSQKQDFNTTHIRLFAFSLAYASTTSSARRSPQLVLPRHSPRSQDGTHYRRNSYASG